jgi:hypothetical protein
MCRMTIRARLVASLMALLVLSVAALVTPVTFGASRSLRKVSYDDARHSAEISAAEVRRTFDSAFVTARDLRSTADAMARQKRPDRALMDRTVRNLLSTHGENFGVWTVWEPNAFDRRDAAYRNTAGTDKTGRYQITRNGRFIGLAGDDLILATLNTLVSGIKGSAWPLLCRRACRARRPPVCSAAVRFRPRRCCQPRSPGSPCRADQPAGPERDHRGGSRR